MYLSQFYPGFHMPSDTPTLSANLLITLACFHTVDHTHLLSLTSSGPHYIYCTSVPQTCFCQIVFPLETLSDHVCSSLSAYNWIITCSWTITTLSVCLPLPDISVFQ